MDLKQEAIYVFKEKHKEIVSFHAVVFLLDLMVDGVKGSYVSEMFAFVFFGCLIIPLLSLILAIYRQF